MTPTAADVESPLMLIVVLSQEVSNLLFVFIRALFAFFRLAVAGGAKRPAPYHTCHFAVRADTDEKELHYW